MASSSRQTLVPASSVGREFVSALGEPRYSISVERGLKILESFSEYPVRRLADVADSLGMKRSTAHRYMSTLAALGYLRQDGKRQYRLGLPVTGLGMSALSATGLREHARPYLEELCKRSSYTSSLWVLDGPEIVCVDQVYNRLGQRLMDLDASRGSRVPAYCTAAGKLLLAYLPKDIQGQMLDEMTIERVGPNSIRSKRELRDELESAVEEGFAVDDMESADMVHAIAAPVRSATREVMAAASLLAPASAIPLDKLVDALGPHLATTADQISARLGYRRDDEITAGHE